MTVTQIGATPANKVDSILRSELDSRRPCIISTASHAFVCDGYEDVRLVRIAAGISP